jgi:hypothetical protein
MYPRGYARTGGFALGGGGLLAETGAIRDAVRARMNSGFSPLPYRAEGLDSEAVRNRENSGSSPHHRFSPDLGHERGIAARRSAAPGVPFLHERR